jgi:hypothetical protein
MNCNKQACLLMIFLSSASAEDHTDACQNYIATPGWVYCLQSSSEVVLHEAKVPIQISNAEFVPPYPVDEGELVPLDLSESLLEEGENEIDVIPTSQ